MSWGNEWTWVRSVDIFHIHLFRYTCCWNASIDSRLSIAPSARYTRSPRTKCDWAVREKGTLKTWTPILLTNSGGDGSWRGGGDDGTVARGRRSHVCVLSHHIFPPEGTTARRQSSVCELCATIRHYRVQQR